METGHFLFRACSFMFDYPFLMMEAFLLSRHRNSFHSVFDNGWPDQICFLVSFPFG